MARPKRSNPKGTVVMINGRELLRLVHLGARRGNQRQKDAAASLRSLLALNLAHESIGVPQEMMPHLEVLQHLSTNK